MAVWAISPRDPVSLDLELGSEYHQKHPGGFLMHVGHVSETQTYTKRPASSSVRTFKTQQ